MRDIGDELLAHTLQLVEFQRHAIEPFGQLIDDRIRFIPTGDLHAKIALGDASHRLKDRAKDSHLEASAPVAVEIGDDVDNGEEEDKAQDPVDDLHYKEMGVK